jgi:hypothetical protein
MLLLSCKECGATYFSTASTARCPDCGAHPAFDSPARGRAVYPPGLPGRGKGTEFGRLWMAALGQVSARQTRLNA